ncbi:aldo/keto reductase [Streptomyces albidoflavus]
MRLPGPGVWGPPTDRAEAVRVLRTAVDLGVNFLDTADSYGPAVAEELIRARLSTLTPTTSSSLPRPDSCGLSRSCRPVPGHGADVLNTCASRPS